MKTWMTKINEMLSANPDTANVEVLATKNENEIIVKNSTKTKLICIRKFTNYGAMLKIFKTIEELNEEFLAELDDKYIQSFEYWTPKEYENRQN